MRLVKLYSRRYTVAAPADEDGMSEAQRFLMNAAPDMQASARGMIKLFERYAEGGRNLLTSDNFHEANKEEGIWEFIKGRLRVFCFMDGEDRLVILSHGAIKKSQKADKLEVAKAARLKRDYLAAKAAGGL